MRTLRAILDDLTDRDRRVLEYAFEHGLSQMVQTDDPMIKIGVNIGDDKSTEVIEQVGVWSLRKRN